MAVHLTQGEVFWPVYVAAVAALPTAEKAIPAEPMMIDLGGGLSLPVVTLVLGALGVLLSRPLARRNEAAHGLASFILTSAIMLIVVELWVIESRPSWLFAFVVAIGLGFSGYSLIEMVGEEARTFISNMLSKATLILQALGSKTKGPKS